MPESEVQPQPAKPASQPRKGHGRGLLSRHLPRQRVEHDVPEQEKVCPCCGKPKERIGEEISEQLDYQPASVVVVEHARIKYACRSCEEHVSVAAKPAQPIDKGLPGPGLLAHVVVSKYADHLPLNRQEGMLARHGVKLSRSTLCGWVMAAAERLEPFVQEMKRRVLQSAVIHADDTPVQVQTHERKPSPTHRAFLWTYVGDEAHPYTVYDFTWTRNRDGPKTFLQDFTGCLQADAYAGYEDLYVTGRVTEAGCWAHGRRKFHESKSSSPAVANEALLRIQALYKVEEQLSGASFEEKARVRQAQAAPLLESLRVWMEQVRAQCLPKSGAAEAAAYALNNWTALTRYVKDGRLDIDNNEAERALRPLAVGRKNWMFAGSERGGRAAASLYTVIQSAKRHKLDPFAYVRDLLDKVSTHPATRIEELLPDHWKPPAA